MSISIGDALLKLGVDTKDLDKGMQNLGNRIKQHQKAIGIAMVAAGGAILAAGALSVKTYAQMGDEVQKMALRTGFSTEALSELRHAAEISGASLSTLEKGVKRMSGTILDAQDGLETYIRAFRHIGIEVQELDGLNPEQQFLKIAEAIAELEDPTKRAAIAQDIFGRAGTELLPLFAAGKEGLAALRQEAHDLGIVFDQEAANKAAKMTDAMKRLEESMSGVKMVIAENLIPVLMPLIEKIKNVISGIAAWMKEHPKLSQVIVLGTAALGGLLVALGTLLLLMPGITAATTAFGISLNAAIWPITLVVGAIAGLIAIGILLWKNWDKVVDFFKRAWANIKIFFLEGVKTVLETLDKFLGFLPGLGDKIREARDTIANMIEAEKIKKDVLDVNRALKENEAALADNAEAIENTTAITGEYSEALLEEQEQLMLTSEALEDQAEAYENLLEKANDAIKQFQYERSEAGRLGITTRDVTTALIQQGWTADRLADLWEQLGDDVDYADRYLSAVGLSVAEVTDIVGALQSSVKGLSSSLTDLTSESEVELAGLAKELQALEEAGELTSSAVEAAVKSALTPELASHVLKLREATLQPVSAEAEYQAIKDMAADYSRLLGITVYKGELYAAAQQLLREEAQRITGVEIKKGYPYPKEIKEYLQQAKELQTGAIVMRPMLARIAEKSPEAVIPLDRMGMALGGRQTADIRIYLDGRLMAEKLGAPLVDVIRVKTGVKI